jgi:hypothetical protein
VETPRPPFALTPTWAATLVSGVALCLGAAPTVTDRDAGELATAAFRLDVAHPTGCPFDLALLRFAALVPLGDVALRMNLAVAALGAFACALVASLGVRLARDGSPALRWACALTPVVTLLASASMVRVWTAVEVYAAALLLALGALWAFDHDAPVAVRRRSIAALAGLSLFSLHTSVRPAVALALAVLTLDGVGSLRALVRRCLPVLTLTAATVPFVLWLPIASRRNGPIDWNDPETLPAVARHLSAASIRAAFAHRMFVAWRVPEDVAQATALLWDDLGPVALVLAVLGLFATVRHRGARLLAAVGAIDLVYAVLVNPMGMKDRQTFFHLEATLALLAAFPLVALDRRVAGTRWRHAAALVAGVSVAVSLAWRDPSWVGRADGWTADEVLGGAVGASPPRALVLCGSDDLCGVSAYAQWVVGERPDVVVLPRQHLAFAWTWRRLRPERVGERVAPVGRDGDPAASVARAHLLLERYGDRVRWEGQGDGEHPSIRARWRFGSGETPVLARVGAPVTEVDRGAAAWVGARLAPSRGAGARYVGAVVLFAAGSRVAREDLPGAVGLWRAALAVNPEHVSSYTNLGVAAAREGDVARAIALTRAALALDPERPGAWRNLRDYLRATGDLTGADEAEREMRRRR